MPDRKAEITVFLQGTPYADWAQTAIPGDASARRYARLTHGEQCVILMDDPPGEGASTAPFERIAKHLVAHGLAAPNVLAHDATKGLMLITDLGAKDFATTLKIEPKLQPKLYRAATDVLIHLRTVPAPDALIHMTPKVSAEMIGILGDHYSSSPVDDLMTEVETALINHTPHPQTLALRDYHVENLIWRPDKGGLDRVGLLDFQDAFIAPEGYDLASLLRDARRDVPHTIVEEIIDYYISKTNASASFRTQLAVLGVQRNLRILGVFARLAKDQGKTRYLRFMPRVWNNILKDLSDPALRRLSEAVHDCVPPPSPRQLEGLKP